MDTLPITHDLVDDVIASWGVDFEILREADTSSDPAAAPQAADMLDTSARAAARNGFPRFAAHLHYVANCRRAQAS